MKLEVLIADDDYISFIQGFREKFKDKINFTCVEGGVHAVKLVGDRNYDLIILDYNMPFNGYETAKKIRELKKDSKIIGYSALWNETNAQELGLLYYSGVEKDIERKLFDFIRRN
ncbi:response regulator [Candidatus Woesearchaeota archaeon]|nr:response regulator [Candidatus Woesearchaeota archaeon]